MQQRVNNIQVLRGLAAALVVFYHAGFVAVGKYPTGVFGVDIFFVISGFVMAMICEKSPSKFFSRRLIRIVPPYWAFTLFVFSLAALAPKLIGQTSASVPELLQSLFFIPFRKGDNIQRPTLVVGWTLNYEMYFYTMIALALTVKRNVAPIIASVAVIAFCVALPRLWPTYTFAQFYGGLVALEFPMGVMAYYAVTRARPETLGRLKPLLMVLCTASLLFLVLLDAYRPHPFGSYSRCFTFGLPALLLVAGAAALSRVGADSRSRALTLLGDASYVLYLSHSFVLMGFERVLHRNPASSLLNGLVALTVSVGVAIAIHLYAEKPMLAFIDKKLLKRRPNPVGVLPEPDPPDKASTPAGKSAV